MKTAKLILIFSLFFWTEPIFSQNIKVITYNIRYSNASDSLNYWEFRKAELVDFLRNENAQIIGLQEVLLGQLEYLKAELIGFQEIGVGRDDGKNEGEYSPIFVDTMQLKILESGTFWLSETPNKPSKGWDAALNRICTWTKVMVKKTGIQILVCNSHFDHIGKTARDSSSGLIARFTEKKVRKEKIPLMIMGDFNSEPNDAAIQNFRKNLNDASYNELDNLGLGTFNGFKKHSNDFKQIDFVFYNGLKKERFQTIRPLRSNQLQLSDHYAVGVLFSIEK